MFARLLLTVTNEDNGSQGLGHCPTQDRGPIRGYLGMGFSIGERQ